MVRMIPHRPLIHFCLFSFICFEYIDGTLSLYVIYLFDTHIPQLFNIHALVSPKQTQFVFYRGSKAFASKNTRFDLILHVWQRGKYKLLGAVQFSPKGCSSIGGSILLEQWLTWHFIFISEIRHTKNLHTIALWVNRHSHRLNYLFTHLHFVLNTWMGQSQLQDGTRNI